MRMLGRMGIQVRRVLKKVISKAAVSEEGRRTLRYVEPLSEARTKLAAFFSILLLYEQ